MEMQILATINNNFKWLIKGGNYENLILELMNISIKLFPNQYEHIDSQAKGECDFIDIQTGTKYDAKLPFTPSQGQLIGSNNANYEKWITSMLSECAEFSQKMIQLRDLHNIEELTLYEVMKKAIENDKVDENIIFFFPFPIVCESSGGIFSQFASDILSNIYDTLNRNGIIKERKVYTIYPSIDNKLGIRLLNTGVREWFTSDTMNQYIEYDAFLVNNNSPRIVDES